jgi:hypothetical protein
MQVDHGDQVMFGIGVLIAPSPQDLQWFGYKTTGFLG